MSIETWKAEFYPVEAGEVPAEHAVEHSLQKWIGLRPENLAKHGLYYETHTVIPLSGRMKDGYLSINSSTCALCELYSNERSFVDYEQCAKCPLARSRGGVPCDNARPDEEVSPYHARSPEPMIAALIAAKEFERGSRCNDTHTGVSPPRTEDPVPQPDPRD